MKILCLDFDGVLHSYSSGWQGADVISDPPVPGAISFLEEAVKHFEVHIFSSRSHQSGGIAAMIRWLAKNQLDANVYMQLKFPTEKPPAFVTLDDRALTFTGVWPSMVELAAFVPWNKK